MNADKLKTEYGLSDIQIKAVLMVLSEIEKGESKKLSPNR